jgi:hypothetical protein
VVCASRAAEGSMSRSDARWLSQLLIWQAAERAAAGIYDSAVAEPSQVGPRTLEVPDTKEVSTGISYASALNSEGFVSKEVTVKDPLLMYRGRTGSRPARGGLKCFGTQFFARCTRA